MQVEEDKEERAISVVEAIHIRDREFEPFAFRINSESLPELWSPTSPGSEARGARPRARSIQHATLPRMYTARHWMPFLRRAASASYREYQKRLKEGYELQGVKFGVG